MFDSSLRQLVASPRRRLSAALRLRGMRPGWMAVAGLVPALVAAFAVAAGQPALALVLFLAGLVIRGLDDKAEARTVLDYGSYLTFAAEFVFWPLLPLGFALADPAANGIVALLLVIALYFNGATALGQRMLARRHDPARSDALVKRLHVAGRLVERAEIALAFALFCLFPGAFFWLALLLAALCLVTGIARLWRAYRLVEDEKNDPETIDLPPDL